MNWTGGRLQQSKRTRTTLTAKQKSYFASARAKQRQHGNTTVSPFRLSVFGETNLQTLPAPTVSLRRLDEVQNFAPTVSRLDSLDTNKRRRRDSSSASTQDHADYSSPLPAVHQRTRSSQYERNARRSSISPITACEGESCPPFPSRRHHNKHEENFRPVTNDMDSKRLSLLAKLNQSQHPSAKPLRITFQSGEDRDRIGRRRRLSKAELERRMEPTKKRLKPTMMQSHLRRARSSSEFNGFPSDELSLRFGTSIHGSQRTLHPMYSSTHRSQRSSQTPVRYVNVQQQLGPNGEVSRSSSYSDACMLLDGDDEAVGHHIQHPPSINNQDETQSRRQHVVRPGRQRSNSDEMLDENTCLDLHRLNQSPGFNGVVALELENPGFEQQGNSEHEQEAIISQCRPQHTESIHPTSRLIFKSTPQPFLPSSSSNHSLFNRFIIQSEGSIQVQASGSNEPVLDDEDEEPWRAFLGLAESSDTGEDSKVARPARSNATSNGYDHHKMKVKVHDDALDESSSWEGLETPENATKLPTPEEDEPGVAKLALTATSGIDKVSGTALPRIENDFNHNSKTLDHNTTSHNHTSSPSAAPTERKQSPQAPTKQPTPLPHGPKTSENEAWYNYVFFDEPSNDDEENLPTFSSLTNEPASSTTPAISTSAAPDATSSLLAQASSYSPAPPPFPPNHSHGRPSVARPYGADNGTPLSTSSVPSSTRAVANSVHERSPRVVFKKPARFAEVGTEESTVWVGMKLASSSPVHVARRRQSRLGRERGNGLDGEEIED